MADGGRDTEKCGLALAAERRIILLQIYSLLTGNGGAGK